MYATKNPLSLSRIESVRGLLRFMLLKPWQTNINDQLCFAGMGDLGGIERVGASQLCLLRWRRHSEAARNCNHQRCASSAQTKICATGVSIPARCWRQIVPRRKLDLWYPVPAISVGMLSVFCQIVRQTPVWKCHKRKHNRFIAMAAMVWNGNRCPRQNLLPSTGDTHWVIMCPRTYKLTNWTQFPCLNCVPHREMLNDAEVCLRSSSGWAIEREWATERTVATDVRLRQHRGELFEQKASTVPRFDASNIFKLKVAVSWMVRTNWRHSAILVWPT